MQPQKQILPKVQLKENGTVPSPQHGSIISKEANYHKEETRNNLIHRQVQLQQNVPHASHANGVQASENLRNRQEELPRKLTNQTRRTKSVPFGLLLPIILPQLDKDKGIQLTTIYEKLKVRASQNSF